MNDQINKSLKQSPSWQANSFSASQEIQNIFNVLLTARRDISVQKKNQVDAIFTFYLFQ